ncbi:MAG: LysR family transcriptional regulator [Candidatus Eisenbacteria bacterium]
MILDKRVRVFLAVAEAGSFSRAGRKLSLSQSVVSFHIHALEKELGVSLFVRKGRTISLTPEGKLLREETSRLAHSARQIEDRLAAESDAIAKRIYLAGDALTCAFTLPWTLAGFRKNNPDLVYTYQHLDEEELISRLLSGDLDIALVGHPVKHRKLTSQDCFRDEIILVASPGTVPRSITLTKLAELPLLWPTNDRGLEQLLTRDLGEAGLAVKDLNVFMDVENLPILKTFVRAGVGVAFLPRLAVADELRFELLSEVKVRGLKLERTNYLVHRKEKRPREIVARFVEFVQQHDWDELSG